MTDQAIQAAPSDPQAQALGDYPYPQDQAQQAQGPTDEDILNQLTARFSALNVAEELTESELAHIGQRVIEDYGLDLDSRSAWDKEQDEIRKIAEMDMAEKLWSGKPVSNVKFPLIMSATIHFSSRCYPEVVKGTDVVKCRVVGKDDDQGTKADMAGRVGAHMSYQLLEEMDWESELDQLLMSYPIVGSAFKKTYRCPLTDRNVSELVHAKDLVINYWAKSIEKADRVTHTIELTHNQIVERINSGVFLSSLTIEKLGQPQDEKDTTGSHNDEDAPHVFLEQHRWLDLDDDGYQEPYIVLVHKATATVVRICARYDLEGVHHKDGKLVRIDPVCYFTHFKFMPSIDGSFYGLGFGKLLFGVNSAINSSINQLTDAGTAANRKSGFIGRQAQLARTQGATVQTPASGEWMMVPSTGDDMRKSIVELPTKEPSETLFKMMQFLLETGKDLASISDILSGESPGPNVPAASTLALIEQGMKVFSGIFKRLYRSLKDEFKKVARLNRLYLTEEAYFMVLDDMKAIKSKDYSERTLDIVPIADPTSLSSVGKAMKMQALMELRGQGLNDPAIIKRYLLSLDIENPEELLPPENSAPPQPPPEVQAQIDKLNAEADKIKAEMVESRLRGQFASMQTAAIIIQTPTVAKVANELMLSAGFPDQDTPPIAPENVMADPGAVPADMPAQNTSPQFPAIPRSPEAGGQAGIETNRNEGVPQ
jgi:chaperonin GroES